MIGAAIYLMVVIRDNRGLDIPVVTHVIQAEFAQNVVQHIHR